VTSHPLLFEGRRARVALAIDVTQRRQAERHARESAARYEELVENASDLIATVDLESRLTSVNRAFEVAVGMSREELIGRSISEAPRFHLSSGTPIAASSRARQRDGLRARFDRG
jgi:PAS domain-containing protein